MKKALAILIGFIHDFAAGCYAATVLVIFWLNRQDIAGELGAIIFELKKQFFYLGLACVFVVFASGAGRTFTYVENVFGEDAEKMRKKLLIYKHIFLTVLFGAGIFLQYVMTFP